MIRFFKPVTLLILSVFITMTVLCAIPPGDTVRAAEPGPWLPGIDLSKLPESTPGNFTVTWYSAKRYIPGQDPGTANPGGRFYATHIGVPDSGPVDKDKSDAALQSWDTSVPLKTDTIPDLTFDMKNWQPDAEYQDMSEEPKYNWNWCEVDGFIKVDSVRSDASIFFDPFFKGRSDITFDLKINPDNGYRDKTAFANAQFLPFRLRIKCYEPDKSILNPTFSAPGFVWGQLSENVRGVWGRLPAENIYGTLALKDMQSFFQLDAQNYTLTLDPNCSAFHVEDYEYGYADGTDFKPLALGANYLEPANGDVMVRYKSWPNPFITIGAVTLQPTGYLSITGRTPTTASLAWTAPAGDTAPTSFDIYRQKVGTTSGFSPNPVFSFDNTMVKVGSTSGLTFNDQGLSYDTVYAYYVKANYADGHSTASNTVRTDSVTMAGLPTIPENLAIQLAPQASKADIKLSWTASSSTAGIREYVIYRKITRVSTSSQIPDGTIILGDVSDSIPIELARTSDLSYIDCGLNYSDRCEYSVQAVDKNGVPSYISPALEVALQDFVLNEIFPNTLDIYNGDMSDVTVTFNSGYTGDKTGTWTVADSSIVSVEGYYTKPIEINPKHTIPGITGAKVTGLKIGTTTVTFTNAATGAHGDCTVTVKPSFTIAPDPLTVYEGETGSLSVDFDNGYTGLKEGRWIVDDQGVALIDQYGVVTGIKAGTVVAAYVIRPTPATFAAPIGESAGSDSSVSAPATMSTSSANNYVRNVSVVVKPANYTVSFDAAGGSPTPESVTIKHDTTVASPDNPSCNNCLFLGWYTAADGGYLWNFTEDKVTKDMTLYAQWATSVTPSSSSSGGYVRIAPLITGTDSIDLPAGYLSTDQAYTVRGNPAPTFAITANNAGATLSGNTLTIPSGLSAGSYSVTLEATNSVGTATKTVTVIVSAANSPTITGPDTINLTAGYDDAEETYVCGGNPAPTLAITANTAVATLSGNTLTIPAGLSAGSYSVTLEATNSAGTVTKTVTVNVSSPPTIEGPDSINLPAGYEEYQQIYTFGGDPLPTEFELTEPNTANATFDAATGTLTIPTGLPASEYPYYVTIKATSTAGMEELTICVYVTP